MNSQLISFPENPIKQASDIRFRCSGLSLIMSDPRTNEQKKRIENGECEALPNTVKKNLWDVFGSAYYGRKRVEENKYTRKGHGREEDCITLVSKAMRRMLKKNTVRLTNDFITGETDCFIGESIEKAKETLDMKAKWDWTTLGKANIDGIEDEYEYQGHGYMWLTGAEKHTVAHCLVNGLPSEIIKEKNKLKYFAEFASEFDLKNNLSYIRECVQIERNMIFDMRSFIKEVQDSGFEFHSDLDMEYDGKKWIYDIPESKRICFHVIERDETVIKQIEDRVQLCWKWIDAEFFHKKNYLVS